MQWRISNIHVYVQVVLQEVVFSSVYRVRAVCTSEGRVRGSTCTYSMRVVLSYVL